MEKIPTIHIGVKEKSKIANTVIMPGDPLRAKYIAKTYLQDVEEITSIRNMLGYTGCYKGRRVTVMGSGMGMGSMGIYAYELYAFYDVETIIRIGTAGGFDKSLNINDVLIVGSTYTESNFAKLSYGFDEKFMDACPDLNFKLERSAKLLNKRVQFGNVMSSDCFYKDDFNNFKKSVLENNCIAAEMECFALFACARYHGKKAGCILTIAGHINIDRKVSSTDRERALNDMIEIALNVEEVDK